jgi:hypothetical protein
MANSAIKTIKIFRIMVFFQFPQTTMSSSFASACESGTLTANSATTTIKTARTMIDDLRRSGEGSASVFCLSGQKHDPKELYELFRVLKAQSERMSLAVLKTNPRAEHHYQMAWVRG